MPVAIPAIFAGRNAHNSLESLVEGAVGMVADGIRYLNQLLVAFPQQAGGFVNSPSREIFQRRFPHQFFEAWSERRPGHARR